MKTLSRSRQLSLACWLLILTALPTLAQDQPAAPFSSQTLVIGTKPAAPFAIKNQDGSWSGISIDLWRLIADALGLAFHFQETDLEGLLTGVQDGTFDASVAALTITAEREKMMDFTHPFHTTGLSIAVALRSQANWWQTVERVFSWQFFEAIGLLVLLLLGIGALIWACEHRHNPDQFGQGLIRGIGSGFWWAAVTMTTVGYGDKAPVTIMGRLLALVWMFTALILAASFIATFTTALTVTKLKASLNGREDLRRARVATVPTSTSANYLRRNGIPARFYPSPPQALQALAKGEVDAMVYDAPIIQYLAKTDFPGVVDILPVTFERQDYGIALPVDSPLRESINQALLRLIRQPAWQQTLERYLGAS